MSKNKCDLKGKIVLQGTIEAVSPLHIGCGSGERSDMDILAGHDERPFIPATSLIGVLRHTINRNDFDFGEDEEESLKNFWGFAKDDDGRQSALRCSDLTMINKPVTVIRDGIKIDNKTGMVKHQGKYDYEILERGATFDLNAEFTYTNSDEAFVKKMVATIYQLLCDGKLQVGAKTNSGLGEIRLKEGKIYHFDFSQKRHVFSWLTQKFSDENAVLPDTFGEPFKKTAGNFMIDATMMLKNSLIIRSYPAQPDMPDATHITSRSQPVLTGTSLKGAIRARAEKIVNTLEKKEDIVKNLFGYVDEDADKPNARKGKIRVHEKIIPGFVAEVQNRIKIDRFTGGAIEGALFDSMPLFSGKNDKAVRMVIEIPNCEEAEAGLLLLVLKDLWTGDLAVGGEKNVGRGVFAGKDAIIYLNNKEFPIFEDFGKITDEAKESLQSLVSAFCNSEDRQ